MSYEIIEKLKKEIEGFAEKPEWAEIGRVIEVGDGIVKILGLRNAVSHEILKIETPKGIRTALALNLEEESIGALVLDDFLAIEVGNTVKRTGEVLSIQVGEELIGRVIDPLGNPQDGLGEIFKIQPPTSNLQVPQRNPLEARAPSVLERESVNEPLQTGIKAIDSMIPIGRGQRELIIGDRQTGKTAIVLDTILSQAPSSKLQAPVICVYVAIGQKESKIVKIAETLKKFDALKYSIIVSASASSPAALWYLAPYAGCSIGEYFRDKGDDVLVIYDDLSKHAWAYREISLLLRRPPGREAYPGDIFYLHSRLLERAAKAFKRKRRRVAYGPADHRDAARRRDGVHPDEPHLDYRRPNLLGNRFVQPGPAAGAERRYFRVARRQRGADEGDEKSGGPAALGFGAIPRVAGICPVRDGC